MRSLVRVGRLSSSARASLRSYDPALHFFVNAELVEIAGPDQANWTTIEKETRLKEIGLQIRKNFASEEEQNALAHEIDETLFRHRPEKYESGHWDNVISHYRETEKMNWKSPVARRVIERMKAQFPATKLWRPAHILDLQKEGSIRGHVDAVSVVGDVVCGLSLLSPSVMRFYNDDEEFRVLLLPGSLYIMAGESRYSYKHAIDVEDQTFGGKKIEKNRRISVMIRDWTADMANLIKE